MKRKSFVVRTTQCGNMDFCTEAKDSFTAIKNMVNRSIDFRQCVDHKKKFTIKVKEIK